MQRITKLALIFWMGWSGTPRGLASTIAYEGFDYFSGDAPPALLGQNGGQGFSTPWRVAPGPANTNANYVNLASSLNFGGVTPSGGTASSIALTSGIGGIARTFSNPLGADNTTAYMSLLLRPDGVLNAGSLLGFFGLFLEGSATDVFIGKPGGGVLDEYVVEARGGANQVTSGVRAVVGHTALLVLRAEFLPGNDRYTLYVNPSVGDPEPVTGAVSAAMNAGSVSGIEIFSTGAFRIDEIRIGDTYADVTAAVPEPAKLVPVGLALIGLGIARRRRAGTAPIG